MPVEPATQLILDQMAAAAPIDFATVTPEAFRELFRSGLGVLDLATAGQLVEDSDDRTIPGPAGPLRIRIYRPPGSETAPSLFSSTGEGGSSATSTPTTGRVGSCPAAPGPWW